MRCGRDSILPQIDFAIKFYTEHNHEESTYWAPLLKAKGGDAVKVVDGWIKEHDEHVDEMKRIHTYVRPNLFFFD